MSDRTQEELAGLVVLRWGRPPEKVGEWFDGLDQRLSWLEQLPQGFLIQNSLTDTNGDWTKYSRMVSLDKVFDKLVDWMARNPGRF